MNHSNALVFLIATSLAVTGCASRQPTPEQRAAQQKCDALMAQMAAAEDDKKAATQKKKDAYKARVPILVAARFANGQSEMAHADQRIGAMQAEFDRLGCNHL